MTEIEGPIRPRANGAPRPNPEYRSERPVRPSLKSPNAPPVVVKAPPPLSIRLSQLLWVLSFLAGAVAIVYFFVIREDQLPLIEEAIRAVDDTRTDDIYTRATDIVYWSAFGVMIAVLLIQITLLVSFMSRKPGVRWWQLSTVIVQALLFGLALEVVGGGETGLLLRQTLVVQLGLVIFALLMSVFPGGVAWSARQHDIQRRPVVRAD